MGTTSPTGYRCRYRSHFGSRYSSGPSFRADLLAVSGSILARAFGLETWERQAQQGIDIATVAILAQGTHRVHASELTFFFLPSRACAVPLNFRKEPQKRQDHFKLPNQLIFRGAAHHCQNGGQFACRFSEAIVDCTRTGSLLQ